MYGATTNYSTLGTAQRGDDTDPTLYPPSSTSPSQLSTTNNFIRKVYTSTINHQLNEIDFTLRHESSLSIINVCSSRVHYIPINMIPSRAIKIDSIIIKVFTWVSNVEWNLVGRERSIHGRTETPCPLTRRVRAGDQPIQSFTTVDSPIQCLPFYIPAIPRQFIRLLSSGTGQAGGQETIAQDSLSTPMDSDSRKSNYFRLYTQQ